MNLLRLLLAAASVLALAACAPAPKPAVSVSTSNALTAPQIGAAPVEQSSTAAAGQSDSPIVGPDGAVWLKSGEKSERYRDDADNCFSFARARVDRDARFESDASAANSDFGGGTGLRDLRQRMNNFERENRMPRLFGQCMEAKGYTRG